MKFLFEIGDALTEEKYIAEKSVQNPKTDIIKIHREFMNENHIVLDKKFIPLGTVNFCRDYMQNMGKHVCPIDYPRELDNYLCRKVKFQYGHQAKPTDYVKPVHTKQFTCDVKSKVEETLEKDLSDTLLWISEPIEIIQEYRVYVLNNRLAGYSRYDDRDEKDILPDFNVIFDMIADYARVAPASYTLDVGINPFGGILRTVLIEVNDMWATGFYKWGTMTGEKYLECLQARWYEIVGYTEPFNRPVTI